MRVAFVVLAEPLIAIFSPDPAVRTLGASALRIISYGYVFYAWGMVMVQAFNGAGGGRRARFEPGCFFFGYFFFAAALRTRAAARLASSIEPKPITAEYLRPTTWATRKCMLIPERARASPMA
jgi:hypothetical protein